MQKTFTESQEYKDLQLRQLQEFHEYARDNRRTKRLAKRHVNEFGKAYQLWYEKEVENEKQTGLKKPSQ